MMKGLDQNVKEISVLPTSAPLHPSIEEEVALFFEKMGFSLRFLLNPFENYGLTTGLFTSHSVGERLEALKEEFLRDEPALILSARGGVGAQEILPFIKELPAPSAVKIFSGFSDFTFLFGELAKKKGVSVVHGPSLLSFRAEISFEQREDNWKSLEQLVGIGKTQRKDQRKEGHAVIELLTGEDLEHLSGATDEVFGELFGGNLSVLCSLLGSPYSTDINGKILFLEEVREAPHKIYRNLLHLESCGIFEKVKGVVLGEFVSCNHPKGLGPQLDDIFQICFEKYDFPVYRTNCFGHGASIQSFPIHERVSLSSSGLTLRISLSS